MSTLISAPGNKTAVLFGQRKDALTLTQKQRKSPEIVRFQDFYGTGIHNVLDEKHRHECAYSTVPQRYLCFHHKKRGIIMKKVKIKLDDVERRILVKLLYEKRNELIREGRYTDAIDELILKIIDAKGC